MTHGRLGALTRPVVGAAGMCLALLTAGPAIADPAPPDPTIVVPAPVGPATDPLAAAALLMPQNFGMARIDAFQGAHALLYSTLGRLPGDQLGQPLPGTAPPPGTAVPPGLVQYLEPPLPAIP